MGWRTAAGQMAAGTYDAPGDQEGAGFAAGFASTFVPALSGAIDDYVTEKRDKRMLELKESLYRQRAAGTASRSAEAEATKLLKQQMKYMATAKGIATSLGVDPTEENLSEIYNSVVSHDGDGSQALSALEESINNLSLSFGPATAAPPPSEDMIQREAVDPLAEDLSAAEPAPAPGPAVPGPVAKGPTADPTSLQMSYIMGPSFDNKTPEIAPEEGVKVASNEDDPMLYLALKEDKPVADQGEEVAVQVADASGNVGGAKEVSYPEVVRNKGSNAQAASVLKFTGKVTPFSELSNETEIQANLIALGERTDPAAVKYRQDASALLAAITELPDVATMTRAERQAYIDGGYQKFSNIIPPENLQAHLDSAMAFQQSGQSMPAIPATLEDKQALSDSIAAGVYGPLENIPTSYLDNLHSYIQKGATEKMVADQFGDVLNVTNLLGKSPEDLQVLRGILEAAGVANSTLATVISIRDKQGTDGEFRKYGDNVTTSQAAISALALATSEGASAEVINSLEKLRDTLSTNEAVKSAQDNGLEASAVMARVIISGVPTIREVVKYPNGTGPDGRTYVVGNVDPRTEYQVFPITEEAFKAYDRVRTENSTLIKDAFVANEGLAQGLRNASTVLEIAQANPLVITSGGDLAQSAAKGARAIGSIFEVANSLFENQKVVSIDQLEEALKGKGISLTEDFVNGIVTGDVQNLASATSMFEAQVLLLAFRMGSLEGQSGAAMSNKDFDRLMSIVDTSNGDISTFTAKLQTYMNEKIAGYGDKVYNVNSQLDDLKSRFGYYMAPLIQPFDEFVYRRNDPQLIEAFERFSKPMGADTTGSTPAAEPAAKPAPAVQQEAKPAITIEQVGVMNTAAIDSLIADPAKVQALSQEVFDAILERAKALEQNDAENGGQ